MQVVTKKRVIGDRQCQVTEMWDGVRLIGVRGALRCCGIFGFDVFRSPTGDES